MAMGGRQHPARRIAVLHLNQIGDLLFSLPLLYGLRSHGPEVQIVSVVRPHLEELVLSTGLVDDVVVVPGKRTRVWAITRALRRGRFDLVLVLSGSHAQVLGAYLSRARWRVGFSDAALPMLLTSRAASRGIPSISKMMAMARHLGCDTDVDSYTGLIRASDEQRRAGRRLLASAGAGESDRFAALAPGASARRSFKAWHGDGFAAVAGGLAQRYGLVPVIIGGRDDRDQAEEICRQSRVPTINLTGRTTTGEALGVLAACSLLVGVDSGLMHLAAALDLPVVALFGPTDPAVTGPRCSVSTIVRKNLPCSPCHDSTCRRRECLDSIVPEEVLDAVASVLPVSAARASIAGVGEGR